VPALAVPEFAFAVARVSPPRAHVKAVVRAPALEEFAAALFDSRLISEGNACDAAASHRRLPINRNFKAPVLLKKFKYCYPGTIARWTLFVILRAYLPPYGI
jgi:hypothetical protein